MKTREFTDLILLAALWGASFLFMRIAVPEFGPVPLVALRVAIAALVLLPLVAWRGGITGLPSRDALRDSPLGRPGGLTGLPSRDALRDSPLGRPGGLMQLRTHGPRLALLGGLNSALPFVLLSYATLTVTAGFAAILNATTPLWTAAIGALWLRDRITRAQWVGLGLGLVGVTVLVWGKAGLSPGSQEWAVTLAVLAALLATACYGLAAHVSRRLGDTVAPLPMAAGSQVGSTLLLAPLAYVLWPAVTPSAAAWGSAFVLGIGCTALAYLLYFRLIARIGAVRASAVAFLIPAFASAWGFAFLHEPITLQMLLGGAIILLGTGLSLRLVAWPGAAKPPSARQGPERR
ncbi:MAG: DMT family transporter [Betaproteobacteria bacterium]